MTRFDISAVSAILPAGVSLRTRSRNSLVSQKILLNSVLTTPGVTFVNLQYGESAAEIVQAKQELGIDIWTPPGINLKDDLDDVAALTCALDLTIGFANATTNIAAACGAPTWMISVPGAWTRLGTEEMPWYPATRIFLPRDFGVWDPVMADVAIALATKFPA